MTRKGPSPKLTGYGIKERYGKIIHVYAKGGKSNRFGSQ